MSETRACLFLAKWHYAFVQLLAIVDSVYYIALTYQKLIHRCMQGFALFIHCFSDFGPVCEPLCLYICLSDDNIRKP